MSTDAVERPLTPNIFARLAQATRYAITGASPDAWFGPQQPLAPMAPPEVKGRQFDYAFGANLNYNPRSEGGISFAELRALADALPLLRAVIETRKDQIAAQNFTVRQRARADRPDASPRIDAALRFLAPARPAPLLRRLAAHADRGPARHRRGDDLSALYALRRALFARRHRRGDDQAADRRGRARSRGARPGLSAGPAWAAGGGLFRRRAPLSAAQRPGA